MTDRPDLSAVLECAIEAGRRIMEVYAGDFAVSEKSDRSPLTAADLAAHHYIVAALRDITPGVPVLSEESAATDYAERARWGQFWLVDPLDGTKEFIKRNGEFTVNIALIESGSPVLGAVHAPALGVSYAAASGAGAYKVVTGGDPLPISARPYAGGKAVVVVSRSHADRHVDAFLASLAAAHGQAETRSMGSSLKLCLVAEGVAHVYPRLGPTSEWDTAAAQCVVEAAGGSVMDFEGRRLAYNKQSLLNPWFLACGTGDHDWRRYASAG